MGKVFSFYDNKGKLHVDCTECVRGINGPDEDDCCSAGYRYKKGGVAGCFIGEILPTVDLGKAEHLR